VAQSTGNADAVLKNYYLGPIREQLNMKAVLMFNADAESDQQRASYTSSTNAPGFRGIARESEDVEFAGRQWIIPAHTSRNEGLGAIAEGGAVPVAGQQGWTDLQDSLKHNLGTIGITRYAIRLSNRNEGVFLKLLEGETKGVVNDIRKDVNRQGYGNQTGALAAVTADGANTVTVDSVQYLRVGMRIDLVDVTNDTVFLANRNITAINASTKVVTYSGGDVTATTNHRLCRTGSWKREINGLGNIINNTGTLHGVDSTQPANNFWKAQVQDSAGNAFSEDLGQQVIDAVDMTGNGEVEFLITTHGIVRRYSNQLKAFKRFTDANSVTLRGGFKALLFNEMPMIKDVDCPKGNMYLLNSEALMWIYLPNGDAPGYWDWVDDDGAILSRNVDGTDGFTGYLAADHDLATTARNQLGKIINLDDDAAGIWS
jgi:hypothetical protein